MKIVIAAFVFLFIAGLFMQTTSAIIPQIEIISPQNKEYYSPDVFLDISTGTVLSDVSYSLNDQTLTVFYSNAYKKTATVLGKQGQNKLVVNAENGTDKNTQALSFNIQKCTIDLRNIKTAGNSIIFTVENTGTLQQALNYTIKVNLDKVKNSIENINSGETKQISTPYNFEIGKTYQLEAIGVSNCGATDSVTAGYSKTGPSPCSNPDGEHNTFRTNSTEGKTYKCNNGLWEDVKSSSAEYEYCKTDRCGDGAINCGETQYSCPKDYNSSTAKCNCDNQAFYGQSIKPYAEEFYSLCKTNCSLDCLSDYDCKSGTECKNLFCSPKPGRCAVQIRDLDYTKEMFKGQVGFVFANIKNTGLIRENISARLYVDNLKLNESSSNFEPEADRFVSMPYTALPGQHNLTFEAKTNNCISSDTKQLIFFTVNDVAVTKPLEVPLATEINLQKDSLKTSTGIENAFFLDLKTNQPQIFSLKVSGVPADWLDYPTTIGITESRTVNIFIKPKQAGEFNLTIEVQGKEKTFTSTAKLSVEPKPVAKGIDASIVLILAFLVLVLLLIIVFLGSRYLKLER